MSKRFRLAFVVLELAAVLYEAGCASHPPEPAYQEKRLSRQPGSSADGEAALRVKCETRDGGICRGPKDQKKIAVVFTGHEYAEGGPTILEELKKHGAKASFFLTGDFLVNTNFAPLIRPRI